MILLGAAAAEHSGWSFAEHTVITLGATIVAMVPLLIVLARLHVKADETLRVTNNVHHEERVADGDTIDPDATLGSIAVDTLRQVNGLHAAVGDLRKDLVDTRAEFTEHRIEDAAAIQGLRDDFQAHRSEEAIAHGAILRTVEAQTEVIRDHGRRLDAQRADIDALRASHS